MSRKEYQCLGLKSLLSSWDWVEDAVDRYAKRYDGYMPYKFGYLDALNWDHSERGRTQSIVPRDLFLKKFGSDLSNIAFLYVDLGGDSGRPVFFAVDDHDIYQTYAQVLQKGSLPDPSSWGTESDFRVWSQFIRSMIDAHPQHELFGFWMGHD